MAAAQTIKAAPSLVAKFFPVEVYPVAAPVAAVAGLFTYMLTRTITADPDTRLRANMPIDCKSSSSYGESWRQSVRSIFDGRIKDYSITVFNNGPWAIRRA